MNDDKVFVLSIVSAMSPPFLLSDKACRNKLVDCSYYVVLSHLEKFGKVVIAVKKAVLVVFTAQAEQRIYSKLLWLQHCCSLFAYESVLVFFRMKMLKGVSVCSKGSVAADCALSAHNNSAFHQSGTGSCYRVYRYFASLSNSVLLYLDTSPEKSIIAIGAVQAVQICCNSKITAAQLGVED